MLSFWESANFLERSSVVTEVTTPLPSTHYDSLAPRSPEGPRCSGEYQRSRKSVIEGVFDGGVGKFPVLNERRVKSSWIEVDTGYMNHAGTVQPLDFPFTPSPSGPFMALHAQEEARDAYVTMLGYSPSIESADRRECIALVTVRHVLQLTFGYPNEDAASGDSRGRLGHGISEIVGSTWEDLIIEHDRVADNGNSFRFRKDDAPPFRHFFVVGKDASAQFLARDIELSVFHGESLRAASDEARAEALRGLNITS